MPVPVPTALVAGAIYEVSTQTRSSPCDVLAALPGVCFSNLHVALRTSFVLDSSSTSSLSDAEEAYLATAFAEASPRVAHAEDVQVHGTVDPSRRQRRGLLHLRRKLLSVGDYLVTFTFNVRASPGRVAWEHGAGRWCG